MTSREGGCVLGTDVLRQHNRWNDFDCRNSQLYSDGRLKR
jgi:hypothetical protein